MMQGGRFGTGRTRNGCTAGKRKCPRIREKVMNQTDFIVGLEMELQLRGVAFDRNDLETFVQDVWPLAEENPDIVRWAEAFLFERQQSSSA